jgi:MFS family permease
MLMSNLSSIVVALPHIQREFNTDLTTIKWVSIVGFIVAASLSLCFGRAGDIYGRKLVYRLGIGVYATGAALCTFAPTLESLIAARVVMAVGLGMSSPLAAAIVAASVVPERRGQIMGWFLSFAAAGQLMGPTLGGFILDVSSWRGIFAFNFGLSAALVLVQQFALGGVDDKQPQRLDVLGTLLLLAAYPSLLIALSLGATDGWAAASVLAWLGVAGAGMAAFAFRELTFPAPLISFRLLRTGGLSLALFLLAVTAFVQNPLTLFVPIYLDQALALEPLQVGLLMMSLPLATIIAGPVGGRLADRYEPRLVAAGGVALLGMAVIIYSQLGTTSAPILILAPLVLGGVAGGLFRPANQVGAFQAVAREDFGSVSAAQTSLMMLAGTLGTTIAVAISDSVATNSDPVSFVEAQRVTFLAITPLLVCGVAAALYDYVKRSRGLRVSAPLAFVEPTPDATPQSLERGSQTSP